MGFFFLRINEAFSTYYCLPTKVFICSSQVTSQSPFDKLKQIELFMSSSREQWISALSMLCICLWSSPWKAGGQTPVQLQWIPAIWMLASLHVFPGRSFARLQICSILWRAGWEAAFNCSLELYPVEELPLCSTAVCAARNCWHQLLSNSSASRPCSLWSYRHTVPCPVKLE